MSTRPPRRRRLASLGLGALIACAAVAPAAADGRPPTSSVNGRVSTDLPSTAGLTQQAVSYDATTNHANVAVTLTPTGLVAPWQYTIAVRGAVVATGTSSDPAVTVTVDNNCSITTQSVSATVTDAATTGTAAATLDRSLCPPPPNVPHAGDRILAGPTLTKASFIDRLRAMNSPALAEAGAIYDALDRGGVNPSFALGTFHAESHSGTRGYAVTTRNWGNILYYSWEVAFGATPYAPGNGYTYAKYPTWLASVRAYVDLLRRYGAGGYTTVSSASAHWLGTIEGSRRHLTYLGNITGVMTLLPDDAVPVMTALVLPAKSRAAVTGSWAARDNVGVTAFQLRTRLGSGAWSAAQTLHTKSQVLMLASGVWMVAVRATDAAGNWSPWRSAVVAVDADAPIMTAVKPSSAVVRSPDGLVTVSWGARDNIGISQYQWRTRRNLSGTWSAATATTGRSRTFKLAAGSWYVAVRARDAIGNWGAWRETRVIVPVDDRSYRFSAGTTRRTSTAYYRHTLTTTSRAGATMTASFTGTGFYLVGDTGPSNGRLRVTIDGVSTIVDTARLGGRRITSVHHGVLLFGRTVAAGTHTVRITNLGTAGRPTIGIDGLGFVR